MRLYRVVQVAFSRVECHDFDKFKSAWLSDRREGFKHGLSPAEKKCLETRNLTLIKQLKL